MAMLSLLEISYDGISDRLYLSINKNGHGKDLLHKWLRSEVPGYAGTRLPRVELNRSAVVNPAKAPVPSSQ